MRTVDHAADEFCEEGRFERLPERVQEALGELAGTAKEGLLALSVGVGLGVLAEFDGGRSRRGRRFEGPPGPWPVGGASRPRGRRGHARRAPRAGGSAAGARGRRLGRGAAEHVRERARSGRPGSGRGPRVKLNHASKHQEQRDVTGQRHDHPPFSPAPGGPLRPQGKLTAKLQDEPLGWRTWAWLCGLRYVARRWR